MALAASFAHAACIGKPFQQTVDTLHIGWPGDDANRSRRRGHEQEREAAWPALGNL